MATNYRALCKRLQMALAERGTIIQITQFHVYSEKAGRMVTKYVVARKTEDGYKNIFSAWLMPEVVKFLGKMWQDGEGGN